MSWKLPETPVTLQEALDAMSDLYSAYVYYSGKTDLQFDCMEQASHLMFRAKRDGLKLKLGDLRSPDPPKPDLPLFNAFDT